VHDSLAKDRSEFARPTGALLAARAAVQTLGEMEGRARWRAYIAIASTTRFVATQRRRRWEAARHGMVTVICAAALDLVLLGSASPDAVRTSFFVNLSIALAASLAYVFIATHRRQSTVLPVFAVLALVDVGAAWLALAHPELHTISFGYLLLLPTIVALVVQSSTRVHASWLAAHIAFSVAYVAIATGGATLQMHIEVALLAVSAALSIYGHFAGLQGRIDSYLHIQRINALNRQAGRNQARLTKLNVILGESARTDELTGLLNRLSLRLDLGILRARIARHGQRYALLLADIDHFKAINDLCGHVAGDKVLQAVARSLSGTTRPEDGLYRYGGEEFALLVPVTSDISAVDVAERIRRAVEGLELPHAANPPHGRLTISVGVVTIGARELALGDAVWFGRADEALYRAKAAGRNRTVVWDAPSVGAADRIAQPADDGHIELTA
jgi:diguanylate cyclase (GGDEF)-like protein